MDARDAEAASPGTAARAHLHLPEHAAAATTAATATTVVAGATTRADPRDRLFFCVIFGIVE